VCGTADWREPLLARPSPKVHDQNTIVPSGSLEPAPSNEQDSPVQVAVKLALGAFGCGFGVVVVVAGGGVVTGGVVVVGTTVVVVVVVGEPALLLLPITGPGRSGTGCTSLADRVANDATTANTVAITTPAIPRMA
jgi:hypothetical protein